MKKTLKMIVLIGIPGSGKTTISKKMIDSYKKENIKFARISRDDLRFSMFNIYHDPSKEGIIEKYHNALIKESLKKEYNVIIDSCNIDSFYRKKLKLLCKNIGNIEYIEIVLKTSLEECIKRNEEREKKVSLEVIKRFYKKAQNVLSEKYIPEKIYYPPKIYIQREQNVNLPKCIVCDLDGTLSLLNGRNPYNAETCDQDLPHKHVIEMVKNMDILGFKVIFVSGREDKFEKQSRLFIEKYLPEVKYMLFMRKTGDIRKDQIIKKEIYENHILDKYYIQAIFDDRLRVCRMIYKLGLPLYRVNDPEADF